ncbi:hypothetical protein ACWDYJ_29470, partial [Streptomyces sp. NPDC003042]
GFSKIGDVMAGLKGLGKVEVPNINVDGAIALPDGAKMLPDGTINLPSGTAIPEGAVKLPDNTIKLPEGTTTFPPGTVKLPEAGPSRFMDLEGNIYKADGSLDQSGKAAKQEPSPDTGADTPRADAPKPDTPVTAKVPEKELAGVGGRGGDDFTRVGSNISDPLRTADNTTPGPRPDTTPGGHAPDNMPRNDLNNPGGIPRPDTPTTAGTHAADQGTSGTHSTDHGTGSHGDTPTTGGTHPGAPGTSSLPDSLGNGADDAATGGADDATRAGDGSPNTGPYRPEDLRYGEGSTEWVQRTPEQAKYWHDEHVRLANEDEAWRLQHYEATRGHRLDADAIVDGQRLPKLKEGTGPKWLATDDLPSADREYYRLPSKPVDVGSVQAHVTPKLDELAGTHQKYLDLGDAQRAYDKSNTPENLARLDAAKEAMGDVPNNTKVGEKLGEGAAKLHVVPAEFPNPQWIDLMDTGHGARRFDQLYRLDNGKGDFLIVEAKAPGGDLGWRQGAGPHANVKVKQGTIEYVRTILEEMKARGGEDKKIADQMLPALRRGKVQYVMVQANKHTGTYAGAELSYFDLYRGGR